MARFVATVSIVSVNGIGMLSAIADARYQVNTSDICKCSKAGAKGGVKRKKQEDRQMLKFFKRVRAERADIETLQLRIKELQLSLLPRGFRYDRDRVQTSPSDKMLEVAAKLDGLERKMQKQLARLNEDMVRAMEIVQAMPTPEYRQLLTLRYLTGTRASSEWEQIAAIMGYSVVHVRGYMHQAALEEARKVNTQSYK